ncbi:unnamed protein product [Ceratitis capitata]|uniref:(Mediterranean fruit fly) hypothetical protein n=1 Tax=Ceratitis capitata TaxID=7213 RepID=A0A811V8E3_CERCA|nr:unnamed protein product [Ceratitis capitata]
MKYLSELKLDYVLYEGDFRLEPIFTNLKLPSTKELWRSMNITVTAYPKEEIDRYTLHYFCERLFEIHFNKPVD